MIFRLFKGSSLS